MSETAPMKVMFQTDLEDLATSDKEGMGSLRFDSCGRVYRWVKNASGTALIAAGACLCKFTTTALDVEKRVMSPDVPSTGPSSCLVSMPAGSPVAAIAKSGSDTGCYGWIQVAGLKQVSIWCAAATVTQQPGCRVLATSVCNTYNSWDAAVTSVIDTTSGGNDPRVRGVEIASLLETTGVSTAASAVVRIHCLGF